MVIVGSTGGELGDRRHHDLVGAEANQRRSAVRPEWHQDAEPLAERPDRVDERPRQHRVAATRVDEEVDLVHLSDALQVVVRDPQHVVGDRRGWDSSVPRQVRDDPAVAEVLQFLDLLATLVLGHDGGTSTVSGRW
jgi:hypothetical protein